MSLGNNIRRYRMEAGLTQQQLADAFGVTVGAVSKWEQEQNSPDIALLPEIAGFFGVSIDVLMDHRAAGNVAREYVERMCRLRREKDWPKAAAEAEKALTRYPNNYDVVREAAEIYKLKGLEQGEEADHRRALELLDCAQKLVAQNGPFAVDLLEIRRQMAEIYPFLKEYDKALDLLKQDNLDGINNCYIGMLLEENMEQREEAARYISRALIRCLGDLFRITMTYANIFEKTDRPEESEAVLRWCERLLSALTPLDRLSAFSKYETWLLGSLASVCLQQGKEEAAEEALRDAAALAKRYDASPDVTYRNLRFVSGVEELRGYDNLGASAGESLRRLLAMQPETVRQPLLDRWERLR